MDDGLKSCGDRHEFKGQSNPLTCQCGAMLLLIGASNMRKIPPEAFLGSSNSKKLWRDWLSENAGNAAA